MAETNDPSTHRPIDLRTGAAALGITLDDRQTDQFARYAQMIKEWNARLNLTRIPPEQYVSLHFLDSLALVRAVDLREISTLIDVGTGAGLPGIPLRIAVPHLSVTLLDATRKRLRFLDAVIDDLTLDNVSTLHLRAEDAGHLPAHRERYDLATARAVARLGELAEYLLPLVRIGGVAIAMKSADTDREIADGEGAVEKLGGQIERSVSVVIPGTDVERRLVVMRKSRRTPPQYPRTYAQMKAKPL